MTNSETTLADYPLHSTDKLRYADTDRLGHVNNAVFSTFLETGRVDLLYGKYGELADDGCDFVIARMELDFLQEINWPGSVDIGSRVLKVGRSSFTLEQGVFQDGGRAARANTVIVQMNRQTRKSHPLSVEASEKLAMLVSPAKDA